MSVAPHVAVIAGALGAGYLMIGLLFLRFWSRTRDLLFLGFAVAFALLAMGQVSPALLGTERESQAGAYLLRLAGFSVIIASIIWKNVGQGGSRR